PSAPVPSSREPSSDTVFSDPDHVLVLTTSRRGGLIVAGIVVAMMLLALVTAGVIYNTFAQNQTKLAELALKLYQDGEFAEVRRRYQELQEKYPDSDQLPTYQFMERLCELRDFVHGPAPSAEEKLVKFREFRDAQRPHPLFKQFHTDLWETIKT